MLGFLKDRTRVLVTHNMALCVASADLVVCINSASSGVDNTSSARSEVVACCPPTELNSVIQKLRQQAGSAGSGNGHSSNGRVRGGSVNNTANSSASEGSGGGGISDLSVFLEGLVAAAALVSKEGGSGNNSGSTSTKDIVKTDENMPAGTSMSLQNPLHTAPFPLNTTDTVHSPTAPLSLSLAPDASPRTLLRRQNHSYESLRKGITTLNTPSGTEGCDEVESNEVFASIGSDVYSVDTSGVYAAAHTVPFTTPTHTSAHTAHVATTTPASTSTSSGSITVVEGKSVGTVGWGVYWFYFQACGGVRAVAGIILGTAFTSASWYVLHLFIFVIV